MAGIPPGRLFTLATATKKAIVDYYTATSINLPDRRIVETGVPAADCEMLAVTVGREFPIDGNITQEYIPMLPADAGFYMRGCLISIWVVRCIPGLDPHGVRRVKLPSVAEVERVSELILNDPQRIQSALNEARTAGRLPGCGALAWGSWEALTPSGEVGGGVQTVLMSLE